MTDVQPTALTPPPDTPPANTPPPSNPGTSIGGRRAVRRLAVSRLISMAGSQAALFGLIYEIHRRTDSEAWVTGTLVASLCVVGAMGPISGWLGDHFDRRTVMVASELSAAAVYGVLVPIHRPGPMVALALLAALVNAPFRSASAAAIPNLVRPDDPDELTWANGLLGTITNLAIVGGPVVGGALVAAVGTGPVFAINAVSFVISAWLVARIDGRFEVVRSADEHAIPARMRDGFVTIAQQATLWKLVIVAFVAFYGFGVAMVADPSLADVFDTGAVGYGLLNSTWGVGGILGGWFVTRRVRAETEGRSLAIGMALMAAGTIVVSMLHVFSLVLAACVIGGVGSGLALVPWTSMIQRRTDDAVRSRVFAAAETCQQGGFGLGMLAGGFAVATIDVRPTYLVSGVIIAFGALIAAFIAYEAKSSR